MKLVYVHLLREQQCVTVGVVTAEYARLFCFLFFFRLGRTPTSRNNWKTSGKLLNNRISMLRPLPNINIPHLLFIRLRWRHNFHPENIIYNRSCLGQICMVEGDIVYKVKCVSISRQWRIFSAELRTLRPIFCFLKTSNFCDFPLHLGILVILHFWKAANGQCLPPKRLTDFHNSAVKIVDIFNL